MKAQRRDVTDLLHGWGDGDENALDDLIPLVQADLRRIAGRSMQREANRHTLQPTALVNELYLKLLGQRRVQWVNRGHFYGSAARIMRRLLVDHARIRNAKKRGSGARPAALEEVGDVANPSDSNLIALDDALASLAEIDQRQATIVELRYFTGLSHAQIAEALEVSPRTVRREWQRARRWLFQELHHQ